MLMERNLRPVNKRKENKIAKLNILLSIIMMCIFSMGVCVLAKFYKEYSAGTDVEHISIASYYIDVLEADKATPITEKINLTNLNPGEIRDVVFYVANGHDKLGY